MYLDNCNKKEITEAVKLIKSPIQNERIHGLPSSEHIDKIQNQLETWCSVLMERGATNLDQDSINLICQKIMLSLTGFSTLATSQIVNLIILDLKSRNK